MKQEELFVNCLIFSKNVVGKILKPYQLLGNFRRF